MKQFYLAVAIVFGYTIGLHAQQQDSISFTLEECIKYAMENTVEVQNARVDEQISEARVKETIGIGLPQIDASVSLQHNQTLPRFFSTYATAQGFAGQDENGNPILDLPGLEPGDVVASRNFFQLPSSGSAGLSINQLLFNSSYLVGLKAASTYKDLAYKTTKQTKIDVIVNVTKAYYAVLVNNERISLFDNNIARVDSLLRNTIALNQNGFAEGIDVDRTRVTLNNLKAEKLQFQNLQALSLALLKFQMNYPAEKELIVEGNLADLSADEDLFEKYQENWNYKDRIEYQILETQRNLQELNVKNTYSASYPSLVAFADLGYSTQSPNIGGIFVTNTDINENNLVGPDKWYPYSIFGVTLNVPIFSGLQRMYRVQQSKLELLKIENNFTSLRQRINLSIEQNTITYKNALEALRAQQENMELAERVVRITRIKYEQGVGSNLEVTEAEASLRAAQVNFYNALYDAIVAKTDLDEAYSMIDPSVYVSETK